VPLPGFGNSGGGILMPKLKYRFRVLVFDFGDGLGALDLTRQVITAGRPQIQYNNTPLHSYNNIAYVAQKPEWQPIEVVVRDDISNLVTSAISAQNQAQMNHYTQSSARAASNYKFEMALQTLDGSMNEGINVLEEWYIEGCYLETIQYDSMDYSSSDPVQITMSIRYDNATQGNEASEGNNLAGTISSALATVAASGVIA
jgi:hypothetical protein